VPFKRDRSRHHVCVDNYAIDVGKAHGIERP
jgi:hypothetical protein